MGKERPILFSAPMVRAILEGRKTQTRRVLPLVFNSPPGLVAEFKPPGAWRSVNNVNASPAAGWGACWRGTYPSGQKCPYGAPGDRLWVRETLKISDGGDCGLYAADDAVATLDRWPWQRRYLPSIHMPRWASRITLSVESVRVERVQDISEEDAKAEGVEPVNGHPERGVWFGIGPCYREGFAQLWQDINGADSWHANPWVWVIGFSRVTP